MRIFISHASEDKVTAARPLADALRDLGFEVWFDEYSLRVGDRLREAIDRGLSLSEFGVVILSPSFFSLSKTWPKEELEGLTTREVAEARKVIVPVWHETSFEEVSRFSPTLAGRFAVSMDVGYQTAAKAISDAVVSIKLGESVFAPPTNPARSSIHKQIEDGEMTELGAYSKKVGDVYQHFVMSVHTVKSSIQSLRSRVDSLASEMKDTPELQAPTEEMAKIKIEVEKMLQELKYRRADDLDPNED